MISKFEQFVNENEVKAADLKVEEKPNGKDSNEKRVSIPKHFNDAKGLEKLLDIKYPCDIWVEWNDGRSKREHSWNKGPWAYESRRYIWSDTMRGVELEYEDGVMKHVSNEYNDDKVLVVVEFGPQDYSARLHKAFDGKERFMGRGEKKIGVTDEEIKEVYDGARSGKWNKDEE